MVQSFSREFCRRVVMVPAGGVLNVTGAFVLRDKTDRRINNNWLRTTAQSGMCGHERSAALRRDGMPQNRYVRLYSPVRFDLYQEDLSRWYD